MAKKQLMNMKHFLLTLVAAVCCMAEVKAYDYPYLVLEKNDGTTVAVSTAGVTLIVSSVSPVILTVNNTAYAVSDLSKMYFSQSADGSEIVTIPSLGWATFCSGKALDFTSVSGLTAYTATVSGQTMTLTPLTAAVPANTGIILQGDAGDYLIPAVESANAPESNDLLGTIDGLTVTSDYAYYALGQMANTDVGFRLVEQGVTIPAGKAYYRTISTSAPTYLLWNIHDGMTDIEGTEVQTEQPGDDDGWYTLDGRKLTGKPAQKGLYIWHGKKCVIR